MNNDTLPIADHEAPPWVKSRAIRDNVTGCWLWTGSKLRRFGPQGGDRAVASFKPHAGRNVSRVMWEELRGDLPKSIVVRHSCDNGMCVRPEHLLTGTHKDNSQDAVKRGRLRPGGFPRLI